MHENKRRARFYRVMKRSLKQLAIETNGWRRTVDVVNRLLESES